MRTLALKLNNHTGHSRVINSNLRETIFKAMLYALGALALVYVLLLGNMVFNIIARKALQAHASAMTGKLSELELQYLSMSNKIDVTFAKSIGFQETKMKFATRESLGSLSMANNEL